MSRVAYVNGAYVPMASGALNVEDRGFQFSDGVYEVWSLLDGLLLDERAHLDRLERSLGALRIPMPMPRGALAAVLRETVRRNGLRNGLVYLQVTRGVAPRDHAFPAEAHPTIVVTARRIDRAALARRQRDGVAVVTMPDIRWGRCDIKSVSLLPNVLAKQAAREVGAYEAWLVDHDGFVTEGASSTAWIVDHDGALRTRPLSAAILPGVTRSVLMDRARERQIGVVERPFTVAEAKAAREAFMSAASGALTPIVAIDGVVIGEGTPGPVATLLRAAYFEGAGR
ncbi:MAG: D-amino-acid transaminase [Hyphomonadaceae bacterium]|nr:D-amino-acid transaminase [Hyphomonadaceae bacterium]